MLKGLSAVCLSMLALVPAFSQDREDVSNPAEQAYVLSVTLKVLDRDAVVTATNQARKVTFSGKPIGIKIDGRTIQGVVVFTVYAEKNRPKVLLTQAQLLVKEDQSKEGKWVTILKSIPFTLDEKVEFYPLGKDNFSANNLLFELQVGLYTGTPPQPTPAQQTVPQPTPPYDTGSPR